MTETSEKYKLHRISNEKDSVIGVFEVRNGEIVFPSSVDARHCDMFPAGPISQYTKNRITLLLDNKEKSMYLEKVK